MDERGAAAAPAGTLPRSAGAKVAVAIAER